MNRICLIGRLAATPTLRTTNTGKHVAEFTIAVDNRSDKDNPFWFRVKCWGQTAEFASNYLGKGRLVAVDGRLETRKFTDKDGNNREIVEVVADNVNGLDRPKDDAAPRPASTGTGAQPPDEYDPFADE